MPAMAAKIAGALAVAILLSSGAHVDPAISESASDRIRTCLPHDNVDLRMNQDYGEKLIGQGISSDGTLVEIYMAPKGTFTVIKTSPEGTSCVVDFGDGWRTLNQLESIGFTPDDL